ncbi:hypothetical protein HMPREF0104_01103 [Bacteroides sp. 3_1_19]|nr:hypothetical protein HMPREF0104_01103 [Bacteroides sp. 3_1_19]
MTCVFGGSSLTFFFAITVIFRVYNCCCHRKYIVINLINHYVSICCTIRFIGCHHVSPQREKTQGGKTEESRIKV